MNGLSSVCKLESILKLLQANINWPSAARESRGSRPKECRHVDKASRGRHRLGNSLVTSRHFMDQRIRRPPCREVGLLSWIAFAALLSGCASERPVVAPGEGSPVQARELIDRSLPHSLSDRAGWTADLYAGFTVLAIEPTHENICAVVAVIEQESGFRVDPVVPNLPAVAWREIDERAAHAGVPRMLLHGMLQLPSSTGRSYSDRIDGARTEKRCRCISCSPKPMRRRDPIRIP
jgi:hypothetical protein